VARVQPFPERPEGIIEPGSQLIRVSGFLGQHGQHCLLLHRTPI
jgi:hypothetical protein